VNQEQTIHPIQTEPEQPVETGFNTTVLGGATSGLSALTNLPSFVGCIQDIQINDKRIVPAAEAQRLIKYDPNLVKIGCKRTEQCSPSPCHNSGTCTDLWTKFECKCPRPFLGEKCEHGELS
jgi:protein crumbs